jgi:hypothetical protein
LRQFFGIAQLPSGYSESTVALSPPDREINCTRADADWVEVVRSFGSINAGNLPELGVAVRSGIGLMSEVGADCDASGFGDSVAAAGLFDCSNVLGSGVVALFAAGAGVGAAFAAGALGV